MSKILRNRCQCARCGDVIESLHTHDFKSCRCGAIFTDGGTDYIRRGTDNDESWDIIIDLTEYEAADERRDALLAEEWTPEKWEALPDGGGENQETLGELALTFKEEKKTKRTIVFTEIVPVKQTAKVVTLYVQKDALKQLGWVSGTNLNVTIALGETE